MDARTLSIKTIFGQDRRHVVPLYQRPYVWKRETQWEPLWADIRFVAERLTSGKTVRAHFLGAIVLDQLRKPTGHLETRLVIDGQQRLTTIQLLLEAFCHICKQLGIERHHRALVKLTRNEDPMSEDPDEEFKVWPTNVDREDFRRVMGAGSPEELRKAYRRRSAAGEIGQLIADGYLFFHDVISGWLQSSEPGFEERLEALYTAVREYVRMVIIDLEQEDDAQVIFETLNARGTPLLPSDLVKNFLFHRAQLEGEALEPLHREYWHPFEDDRSYWQAEIGRGHAKRPRIDMFLQHYVTLKTGDEVPVARLYTAFREHAQDGEGGGARAYLESLRTYAQVYRGFDRMERGTPEALFFERLSAMETTTAYPFLMELFVAYASDPGEVQAILKDLESFLVRRMVCQLSTRAYNRLFIDLLGAIRGADGTPVSRVRGYLLSSEAETGRWPKDQEFHQAWIEIPLFAVLARPRVRMLLEALERGLRTEKTENVQFAEKLTIEHLLPQDWRKHWPLPSGEPPEEAEAKRHRVLHTIGNLTLLTKRLNPAVSNGPWEAKSREILMHSALALNRRLQESAEWNEEAIRERSIVLFDVARRTWPHPDK